MVRGPAGDLGIDPAKPKLGQIEFIDEDVDHPNRDILANPVFQAFGKQRALSAIHALNEAPHPILPQIASESYRENQIQPRVFTQPGSKADVALRLRHVSFTPDSGHLLASRSALMGSKRGGRGRPV